MHLIIRNILAQLSPEQLASVRSIHAELVRIFKLLLNPFFKHVLTPLRLRKNSHHAYRMLEFGPGSERLPGFETANIVIGRNIDYVIDASTSLPFKSESFNVVYASHVLEHIPWYQVEPTLREWKRILKVGGHLEIWVPNGLLIAETFVNAENGISNQISNDGWYKFNTDRDPCIWANGRIFSYGDGKGRKSSPNWHMAMFSPRFLCKLLENVGLVEIERLIAKDVRGEDHGWINVGFRGKRI